MHNAERSLESAFIYLDSFRGEAFSQKPFILDHVGGNGLLIIFDYGARCLSGHKSNSESTSWIHYC